MGKGNCGTFRFHEMMYTKLQAGDSYDVVVPSDYMIRVCLQMMPCRNWIKT